MKCPIDGKQLLITERQGVEIDYCPECRGVWLDRGELDKILAAAPGPPAVGDGVRREQPMPAKSRSSGKRKGSDFLSDLFDF